MEYCSTIGQFIYFGEISALRQLNKTAPRLPYVSVFLHLNQVFIVSMKN